MLLTAHDQGHWQAVFKLADRSVSTDFYLSNMNFASALANLEKKASAVASGSSNAPPRRGNNNTRRRPADDARHRGRNQRPRNEDNYYGGGDLLNGMHRFGYRVTGYRPPPMPEDLYERPFHICLIALTIDDLPYEHLWRAWAESGAAVVSLVCHAKHPDRVQSDWLRQHLLVRPPRMGRGNTYADPEYFTYAPEWGSVELARAMVDSLAEAMQIGVDQEPDPRFSKDRYRMVDGQGRPTPADTFIFISETCLPVQTLDECTKAIYGEKPVRADPIDDGATSQIRTTPQWRQSWVLARNRNTPGTPKNKYERDQFSDINRMIPQPFRWKSDQWILLSRPHASAVLQIDRHMAARDQLWNSFTKISASDEMYFPTALSVVGILTEANPTEEVERRQVTYVDWTEGMRNPATFDKGARDLQRVARLARKNGSLFARKFVPVVEVPGKEPQRTGEISVQEWKEVMEVLSQEQVAVEEPNRAGAEEESKRQ